MTIIEQIRAEIDKLYGEYKDKFHQCGDQYHLGLIDGLDMAERVLDTLESEKPVPKDLDFEQELYNHFGQIRDFTLGMRIGQYFYNLGRDSVPLPEDTVIYQKGVEEGKRLMMEEAVKWLVDDDYDPKTEKGRFILGSVGIGYSGYYIPYSDLLKLPKEDEK